MRRGMGREDVSTPQGYASHMQRWPYQIWPYKISYRPAVTLVCIHIRTWERGATNSDEDQARNLPCCVEERVGSVIGKQIIEHLLRVVINALKARD